MLIFLFLQKYLVAGLTAGASQGMTGANPGMTTSNQGRRPRMTITRLPLAAALLCGSAMGALAQDAPAEESVTVITGTGATELHFIMCGGEVRPADQAVIDTFVAEPPRRDGEHGGGAVGHLPGQVDAARRRRRPARPRLHGLAHAAERRRRRPDRADHLHPGGGGRLPARRARDRLLGRASTGASRTPSRPRRSTSTATSSRQAGAECVAPETWDEMIALAKTVTENTDAAGIGLAGKDFDNTMHMFLDFLYSNGGQVIDAADGRAAARQPADPRDAAALRRPDALRRRRARPPGSATSCATSSTTGRSPCTSTAPGAAGSTTPTSTS